MSHVSSHFRFILRYFKMWHNFVLLVTHYKPKMWPSKKKKKITHVIVIKTIGRNNNGGLLPYPPFLPLLFYSLLSPPKEHLLPSLSLYRLSRRMFSFRINQKMEFVCCLRWSLFLNIFNNQGMGRGGGVDEKKNFFFFFVH